MSVIETLQIYLIFLLVKFESEKHELEDVDGTEQLQLKCPVMSDTPHTDGDTQDADNH